MTVFDSGDPAANQGESDSYTSATKAFLNHDKATKILASLAFKKTRYFIYQLQPLSSMRNHKKHVDLPCHPIATNRYHKVSFIKSINTFPQLPPDIGLEVALAGRSNAGKSSALNALTNQRQLARVSKTPGRTRMLNYFEVEPERYLVDLPGYGYAQVPEAVRYHWQTLMERYLRERISLRGLLLLIDVRRPPTDLDCQLLEWCIFRQLPVHILLTKADKLSRGAAQTALKKLRQSLKTANPAVSAQLFSAQNSQGIQQAHAQLDIWLNYSDAADTAQPR